MTSQLRRSRPARPIRALTTVLVAVGLAACGGGDDGDGAGEGDGVADVAAVDGVESERVGPYEHVAGGVDLDYDRPAPSGGDHGPYLLTCGAYEGQVPDELVVHSLEHGAVWIALGPDSSDADREAAEDLADGEKVIVSDVPDLPDPVHLVAWGARLPLESADDPRAEAFLERFVDADSAPEAGFSCENVGEPPTPPTLPPS